ncbi:hypothetical protein FQN57_006668 [Myotisia sp. PD_48]|nr:hypothetical protein FQN57_006668 [Myotisia sp. PD_48]
MVQAGLIELDVDDVVVKNENDSELQKTRRIVAAVITQAFSYMIKGGLEYGYVCTGKTFIFLRGQNWMVNAEKSLKKWAIEHDDSLFPPETEMSSDKKLSEYKVYHKNRHDYLRISPIKTRLKALATRSTCRPQDDSPNLESNDEDSSGNNGGPGSSSPSTGLPRLNSSVMVVIPSHPNKQGQSSQHNTRKARQFCTQKCLLGLINGGPLDMSCPNAADHGENAHSIDHHQFCELVRAQILDEEFGPSGCESMYRNGVSGGLFSVHLVSHGYSLVAKGTAHGLDGRVKYEEKLYNHLRSVQGIHVPVCLGSIDISSRPLSYNGIKICRLMFLSYAGQYLNGYAAGYDKLKNFAPSAKEALRALHQLGVLHNDAHLGNIFWNEENKRVMIIDFERSKICCSKILAMMTPRKRKRSISDVKDAETLKKALASRFQNELHELEYELRCH